MPYKFSPSTLNLFKDCPRCFWLQFNKGIKRPEAIFPSLPSGMDKALKIHFDRFRDKKGNLIKGAVDQLLKKENKLIVLDFKTRGFPLKEDTHEHYIDQLNIYNFLLRKNNYQTEDYAYLLFYHPNKVLENGDFTFHAELIKIPINTDEAEILINEAIECLSKDQPESDIDCEFCKYIL